MYLKLQCPKIFGNFKTKPRSYINEDSVVFTKGKTHGMTEQN